MQSFLVQWTPPKKHGEAFMHSKKKPKENLMPPPPCKYGQLCGNSFKVPSLLKFIIRTFNGKFWD